MGQKPTEKASSLQGVSGIGRRPGDADRGDPTTRDNGSFNNGNTNTSIDSTGYLYMYVYVHIRIFAYV